MNNHTTLALYARGHVNRVGPIPLHVALSELEKSAPAAIADDAWSAAGVAVAIAEAFDEARAIGGRAITDVTFALHTRLGLSRTAPPTPYIQLVSLDPYMEWLTPRMAEGSPWRPIVARWIDIINERLTMHRYADRAHRRRHARDLIAAPLAALANTEPADPLIDFAEHALTFYDLLLADAFATRGWNRIDLPAADQLGGFYSLADEARPPEPAHIASMVAALSEELNSAPTVSPALDPWLARITSLMREALAHRAAGSWPDWMFTQPGFLDRLRSWLTHNS
ncbi:hypothetical protein LLG95_15495 [bacterium]|nr:hypothetical protein [bacterium]